MRKGGRVVCGGIHMSDIPSFPYRLLWEERSVASVANLTRADGEEFLALAPRAKVLTTTTRYPLDRANQALDDLRAGASKARRCSCREALGGQLAVLRCVDDRGECRLIRLEVEAFSFPVPIEACRP